MDEKQRRILERNRCLLVNNIVLTEDFYQWLRRESVIPETMIKDIQVRPNKKMISVFLVKSLKNLGSEGTSFIDRNTGQNMHTFLFSRQKNQKK